MSAKTRTDAGTLLKHLNGFLTVPGQNNVNTQAQIRKILISNPELYQMTCAAFNIETPQVVNSVTTGIRGESLVEGMLKAGGFQYKKAPLRSGDFIINDRIMLEIKNYKDNRCIPEGEVTKFKQDMMIQGHLRGIFLSLNSPIKDKVTGCTETVTVHGKEHTIIYLVTDSPYVLFDAIAKLTVDIVNMEIEP